MKRLFTDTLFRRLFVLLWVALVAAHLLGQATFDWVGFGVFRFGGPPPIDGGPPPRPRFDEPRFDERRGDAPRPDAAPRAGDVPRSSDRPSAAGDGPRFDRPPAGGNGPRFDRAPGERRFDGPPRPPPPHRHMLWLALLDLLVRGIVITIAAWWGARWLVDPISRFSRAAESLGTSLD